MKSFLILAPFLFIGIFSFAQPVQKESYLIVRIEKQDNKQADKVYYSIVAEPYNTYALDIYNLVEVNKHYFVPKPGVSFYQQRTDTAALFYNYFKSETEALDFMGQQSWILVTVFNEITSGHKTAGFGNEGTYTAISSRPVYYFRKGVAE